MQGKSYSSQRAMRPDNPFRTTRRHFEASAIGLLIGILSWGLAALAAEGKIPGFLAYIGVALFVVGWMSIAFAIALLFMRMIGRHRQ